MIFNGSIVIVGLGTIGLGVIPLLLKHIDFTRGAATAIRVITGEDRAKQGAEVRAKFGIQFRVELLTETNYVWMLDDHRLEPGDFLLNLSVDVSSCALLPYCHDRGLLYLDTVVEPWLGVYYDASLTMSQRSNYAMRHDAIKLKESFGPNAPTALITCGANPGLVSFFTKQALLNLKLEQDGHEENKGVSEIERDLSRREWAQLAQKLGLQTIHIAERDTQFAATRKVTGEFTNTWSVDGFLSEAQQPAELGWGTHEKAIPADGAEHDFGCGSAIYLRQPGASTLVRTWTPMEGPFHGLLVTHNESISIASFFTLKENDEVVYRPTVHYAYHPCDDAVLSLHELRGKNFARPASKKVLVDEIVGGADELGVLLMGERNGRPWAYWYGSQLSAANAKKHAEYNSATSLQVTATILGGMMWAIKNPARGILEPDELPHHEILSFAKPYLEPVVGVHTTWTPLEGRNGEQQLFAEDIDLSSPFQFKNVRV